MVIFLSKYFSRAKEKRNKEKADINIDGISVKSEKKAIYFLFALEPSIDISLFIEFLTSTKIIRKKTISNNMFDNNKYCKFCSFNSIKLLPINVKKVKKPNIKVIKNIIIIKRFFL